MAAKGIRGKGDIGSFFRKFSFTPGSVKKRQLIFKPLHHALIRLPHRFFGGIAIFQEIKWDKVLWVAVTPLHSDQHNHFMRSIQFPPRWSFHLNDTRHRRYFHLFKQVIRWAQEKEQNNRTLRNNSNELVLSLHTTIRLFQYYEKFWDQSNIIYYFWSLVRKIYIYTLGNLLSILTITSSSNFQSSTSCIGIGSSRCSKSRSSSSTFSFLRIRNTQ